VCAWHGATRLWFVARGAGRRERERVCVCERERERESARARARQTNTNREMERQRNRDRDRERQTDRQTDRQTEVLRERESKWVAARQLQRADHGCRELCDDVCLQRKERGTFGFPCCQFKEADADDDKGAAPIGCVVVCARARACVLWWLGVACQARQRGKRAGGLLDRGPRRRRRTASLLFKKQGGLVW
jgi:hypothetical protein